MGTLTLDASWESRFCPTEDSAQPSWLSNTCSSWRSFTNSQTLWKPESGPKQRRWKAEAHLRIASKALLTEEELGNKLSQRLYPLWASPSSSLLPCMLLSTDLSSQLRTFCSETYKMMQILSSRKKLTFLSLNATQWGMASRKPERTLSVRLCGQVIALLWAGFSHLWNGEEKTLHKTIHEDWVEHSRCSIHNPSLSFCLENTKMIESETLPVITWNG